MKSTKVLKDHKQHGKRFIPPLLQLGNAKETSYVQVIIPEIIWMAFLHKQFGLQLGTHLALQLVTVTSNISSTTKCFSFISSFELLTAEQKEKILAELQRLNMLDQLRNGLTNFMLMYPECPLSFLFDDQKGEINLPAIKETLSGLYDITGRPATFMMANVIYFLGAMGRLAIVKDTALSKLPELVGYPNTALSKMIASGVRASMFAFMHDPFLNESGNWNKYFWNRGIELEPCKI
jgi:hypothetical protein